jgi:sulfotransferase family protein
MNDDKSMATDGCTASTGPRETQFAPSRENVYPARYYDLGESSLVELWDEQGKDRPGSLVYSVAGLEARLRRESPLPPAAFIFHCSRCGSTLLARLFAAIAANRVFNELGVVHDFRATRWNRMAEADSRRALKALVEAHGLAPGASEARLIVKFDSRAVLEVEALRACFPHVPFIYLLRHPAEVVASLAATIPGFLERESRATMAALFGGVQGSALDYPTEEWYAWYVERNQRLALHHANCFSEVIDYGSFASRYLATVNRISGVNLTLDNERVQMVLNRHSKNPAQRFAQGHGRRPETAALHEAAQRIAGPVYAQWQARLGKT